MLKNVYEGLNARSKVYFCEMYPTCVSSKLCEFIYKVSTYYQTRSVLADLVGPILNAAVASSPGSVWALPTEQPHHVPVRHFLSSEFGILEMWAKGEYQEWLAWDPEREVEVSFMSGSSSRCL